jgi:hypothetical protein
MRNKIQNIAKAAVKKEYHNFSSNDNAENPEEVWENDSVLLDKNNQLKNNFYYMTHSDQIAVRNI